MGLKAIATRLHLTKGSSHSQPQPTESSPQQRLLQLQHVRQLAPALYGQVWLCRDTAASAGTKVAVKTVNLLAAQRQQTIRERVQVREDVHKERRVHATLRKLSQSHSNNGHKATSHSHNSNKVLLVQEEIEFHGVLYMVFELCAGGDLLDVVRKSPRARLDERTCRSFLRDVAQGLQFLHRAGFAHRDISLENVLVTAKGECRLSDFGLACDLASPGQSKKSACERVGKLWYMAPEVYACDGESESPEDACYDPVAADIWSLGILLVIMLSGAPLLSAASTFDRRFQFLLQNGPQALFTRGIIAAQVSSEAQDLICKMLQVTPEKRISLDQVLAHPFFHELY
ncbi:hypothetical protein Gpo141_00000038 [Globisporangium polare]